MQMTLDRRSCSTRLPAAQRPLPRSACPAGSPGPKPATHATHVLLAAVSALRHRICQHAARLWPSHQPRSAVALRRLPLAETTNRYWLGLLKAESPPV